MLWIDKHRPRTFDRLNFHRDLNERLERMAGREDFPHLLFYGPPGAGKRTRVLATLRAIYGPGVESFQSTVREYKISNTTHEVTILASKHHLEVSLADLGPRDRVVAQELIKEIASTRSVEVAAARSFKVLVLEEADRLSAAAQHALRRTMEKHAASCRLVLVAATAARIIPALRSRCIPIRVPAPPDAEAARSLAAVAAAEHVDVEDEGAIARLVAMSGGNFRKALLALQAMCARGQMRIAAEATPLRPEWEVFVAQVAAAVARARAPKDILEVRKSLYKLLGNCIPASIILERLALELARLAPTDAAACEVVYWAAKFDHRQQRGSQPIVHLEAFVARAMTLLAK